MDSLLGPNGVHDDIAEGFHGVGPAQVNAFMRDVLKGQPDYKWNVASTFTDGPHVAMEWTWTSTYTGPGPTGMVKNVPLSGRGGSIVEVENGKIKQFTDYYDNASFFPKKTSSK
jgi:limonene-1,2-epoxide hydrolase